ncbi:hypothetical protein SynA15127_01471 [Synechococcus sp. A15-127]|uniref:hypothetical protein n=1 Tax=Synechococcus sp. A15-127 TaxID=1050624 RepID=UPI0016487170|nr:hypothetical protein [Synechococcus sp. A15-127]QNI94550.1 hypothetical protein SynA15127_01471 [Synechococcus sp. A15-127]
MDFPPYNFDKYGNEYWLWPGYPKKAEQAFSTPSKCFAKFLKRDNPFIFFGKDIYDYCISSGAKPMCNLGGWHDYSEKDFVNLYLARASLKGRDFYKIGLTLLKNPKHRDSKVYKEIVRCKKIPARGSHIPYIYEKYILWRCREARYEKEDKYDPDIFERFAGKLEIVHTTDAFVEDIFDHHFNEITSHLEKHTPISILLEKKFLTQLVRAIYDNEYASAELTAQKYFNGDMINEFFGEKPSSIYGEWQNNNKLWVGLSPRHVKAFLRYCNQKIPPLIESAWHKLDIADPKKREGEREWFYNYFGKRKYRNRFDYRKDQFSVKS